MDRSAHRPSDVSGIEAAVDGASIDDTDRALAMTGFRIYRHKGRTCGVSAVVDNLPGRDATRQTPDSMLVDDKQPICQERVDGIWQVNWNTVEREGDRYFVHGVKVCTQNAPNTDERSIRGLKVFMSRVKDDGTVVRLDEPEAWVNDTGCEHWEERAMCPNDMIAVGFRAHRSGHGYRALGLKCAAVSWRPPRDGN